MIKMRNYKDEFDNRVTFIKKVLTNSGAKGISVEVPKTGDGAPIGLLITVLASALSVSITILCKNKRRRTR
mgnify:CR=1 FL=1